MLGNLAVCVSLLAGIALQRLFFGRLRPIEVEVRPPPPSPRPFARGLTQATRTCLQHLYDKAWYFLTESLLAFTMFRCVSRPIGWPTSPRRASRERGRTISRLTPEPLRSLLCSQRGLQPRVPRPVRRAPRPQVLPLDRGRPDRLCASPLGLAPSPELPTRASSADALPPPPTRRSSWQLDQLASPPRWTFHLRLLSLLLLVLLPLDGLLLSLTAASLLDRGISGRIVFVSEFAVLLVSLGGVAGRYAIWAWDQWKLAVGHRARRAERARRSAQAAATADAQADADADVVEDEEDDDDDDEDVWEGKSMALFYLDLTTGTSLPSCADACARPLSTDVAPRAPPADFLKLTVYLLFFILVLANYGLPFNILRDLYLTSRSFLGRLRSLVQYRAATRDMELRYADATAAEIAEQGVCIICREEMRADDLGGRRAKRLGCGHAFHLRCLRMWLERQQSCPTWCVPFLRSLPLFSPGDCR